MIQTDDIHYLTTEDYQQQVKDIVASIREQLNDIEILTDLFINERYLTASEVATMLKCSVQQIPRDIPCNHIGRNYLYHLSDVQKWLTKTKSRRA